MFIIKMTNKLEQGKEYEKYVLKIVKESYKNAWLWDEIPMEIVEKYGFINNDG